MESQSERTSSPGQFDTTPPSTSPNLVRMFWQHKSLIVLGLMLGMGVSWLYFVQQRPMFEATAQILVVKKRPETSPLSAAGVGQVRIEDYVSTHIALFRTPKIIDRAIELGDFRRMQTFAGMEDLTASIANSLTVSYETNSAGGSTEILNLAYRGSVADECPLVLNAVISSYQEFLEKTYKSVSDDTLQMITKKVEELQKKLTERETQYRQFRTQSVETLKGKDGVGLLQERTASIETERSTLRVRGAKIQARLDAIKEAQAAGATSAQLQAMIITAEHSARNDDDKRTLSLTSTSREDQLLPLLLEEKTLLANFGPEYPELKSVQTRIKFTRELLAQLPQRGGEGLGNDKEGKTDPVAVYIQSLQRELSDIANSEKALNKLLEGELQEAKKLTNSDFTDKEKSNEIARMMQLHDNLMKQLDGINLGKDIGGYKASILSPAGNVRQVEPKPRNIFLIGAIFGLCIGTGLAYLAELSDKTYHSPDDIRRRLGLPVVGHIPMLSPALEAQTEGNGRPLLDPIMLSHFRPKSAEAEAFRGVRTALYFSTCGKGHKVIQVTSPNMADGKSTVAGNLAICMAQAGQKTLLIDADFRRPRLHRLFNVSDQVGLASVIASEVELPEAVQSSGVPNLSILPCGPRPANPAELLTMPRFAELVDALRDQYDFVLIDTPPMLVVTDPAVVASRVDGVLLTVRVSRDGRPDVERSTEILGALGAKILGVVVNGVGEQGKKYGYGYQYNYGEGYRYGYPYKYQSNYYREDKDEEAEQTLSGAAAPQVKGSLESR